MFLSLGLFLAALFLLGLIIFWYGQTIPQSLIYLIARLNQPERGQRVLVLAPHPDDETIGAGGYIAKASRMGSEIWVVLVTDGNKRGISKRRFREFRQACSVLGIPSHRRFYWHYSDGSLRTGRLEELQHNLDKLIRKINPHLIIAPHIQDTHRDHAAIGQVADISARKNKIILYQYLVHYHRFPETSLKKNRKQDNYLLPPLNLMMNEDWRVFHISKIDQGVKREAFEAYRSQLVVPVMNNMLREFLKQNEIFSIIDYS
jgi:LmbE family N-acetylglucosaminyl deacetylase